VKLFNERLRELAHGYKKRYGDLLKYDVEEEISRYNVRDPTFRIKHFTDCSPFCRSTGKRYPRTWSTKSL
jgi:hypothetical protein